MTKAGITKPFRVFHDLRHTAITHDAAAVLFPGAAAKAEARLFGKVDEDEVSTQLSTPLA